jgi:hypothetical protein
MLARKVLEQVADRPDAERLGRVGDLLRQAELADEARRARQRPQRRGAGLVESQLVGGGEGGGDPVILAATVDRSRQADRRVPEESVRRSYSATTRYHQAAWPP